MMIVRYHFLLVMCLIALVLHTGNSPIYAQDTSNNSKAKLYWANAGLGGSSFALSSGISLSSQSGRSLVSIRFIYNKPFSLAPREETVWDVGALYGLSAKASCGFASISGGVGIIGGVRYRRSSNEWPTFLTVGIPIEGQLFWTPLSFLGIGIYGFADLNPEKSFVGALLCIQLGKLR